MSLLLALACGQSAIVLEDTGSGVSDADADTDSDADTDTDTDTDTGTEPQWVADFSWWEGERNFFYDSDWYTCDDTVGESGPEIDKSDRDWSYFAEVCPSCQHFYEVEPDEDSACDGYVSLGQTWRGLEIDGDSASVHLIRDNDGLEEYGSDESATFDGQTVDYFYEFEYGYGITIDITGTATFELTKK